MPVEPTVDLITRVVTLSVSTCDIRYVSDYEFSNLARADALGAVGTSRRSGTPGPIWPRDWEEFRKQAIVVAILLNAVHDRFGIIGFVYYDGYLLFEQWCRDNDVPLRHCVRYFNEVVVTRWAADWVQRFGKRVNPKAGGRDIAWTGATGGCLAERFSSTTRRRSAGRTARRLSSAFGRLRGPAVPEAARAAARTPQRRTTTLERWLAATGSTRRSFSAGSARSSAA